MEKLTKYIPIILLITSIVSVSLYLNITINIKVEAIKEEAREEGRLSVFQNMGDMVVQGQRQINIPYTFKNEAGETQTMTIPFMPILPQPTE